MATNQETLDIIFRLRAELNDMRRMNAEVAKSKRQFADLKGTLARGIGLLGVTATVAGAAAMLRNLTTQTFDYARSVKNMSQTLGVGAEFLQRWNEGAAQFRIGQDVAQLGLQRFTRRLAEARQGTGEMIGVVQQYGIALTDSEGRARSIEEVLGDMADVMGRVDDQGERVRIAMKMFDSDGVKLVQVLGEGKQAFLDFIAAQKNIISDEAIEQMDEAGRSIEEFQRRVRTFMGEYVIPNTMNAGETLGTLAAIFTLPDDKEQGLVFLEEWKNQLREIWGLNEAIGQQGAATPDPGVNGGVTVPPVSGSSKDAKELDRLEEKLSGLRKTYAEIGMSAEQLLAVRVRESELMQQQLESADGVLERTQIEIELYDNAIERAQLLADITEESADSGAWDRILGAMAEAGISTDRLADNLTGIITRTKTWGDVGQAAATMLLNALIKIGLQELANIALTGAAKDAEAAKEMGRLAMQLPMKLMDALATSISSYGVAGILGLAAIVAAIAAIGGGFAEGGIIGGTPTYGRDNRLAAVASGEAIIPTGPTQRHRPLIQDLIAGRDPVPRITAGLASSAAGGGSAAGRGDVNYIEVSDRQALWNRLDALSGEVRVLRRRAGYRA